MQVICAENIQKSFRLYRNPADRLKEIVFRRSFHTAYLALDDVSFDVSAGETLGIVGQNGAGKSTLLKVLNGILLPDDGRLTIKGRVTGLLELGTGFNMDTSGLDNIRSNAMLIGMNLDEIEARSQSIIEFSELGRFMDEPIKTYSSGMIMRLGFAIAIHANPGCFIVDEALSVGDAYFQQKCMRAIHDFRDRGGAILFVSHDMGAIRALCDRAILLEAGRIIDEGSPKAVVDHYHATILSKIHQGDVPVALRDAEENGAAPLAGTGEVSLLGIEITDQNGMRAEHIVSETPVTVTTRFRAERKLVDPHFGIGIRNRFGHMVFETNTYCMGRKGEILEAGETVHIAWQFDANLVAGDYAITLGVGNKGYGTGSFEEILFFDHELAMLKIIPNDQSIRFDGYFNLRPAVNICTERSEATAQALGGAAR